MFLILTLIILVAAFNIISGMIMMVKDKGRDIAILRTMGASRGAILRDFLHDAAPASAIVGTLAGSCSASSSPATSRRSAQVAADAASATDLFAAEIYFPTAPAGADRIEREVAAVVVMALVLSFLATLYPSWRAARLDPVEALRYE